MAGRPLARIGGGGGGGTRGLLLPTFLCGASDGPFLLCDGDDSRNGNEVDFDMNPTGLYVAVHTKQWDLATERLKVYPREASTWVVRYCNSASDGGEIGSPRVLSPRSPLTTTGQRTLRWRMLPLHACILFNCPIELVKALIKVYPMACKVYDDQGMLPLHIAFQAGASEEVVLTLLSTYPEAIERVDKKGRLPSNIAPKDIVTYGDTIGEAFVRGPSYYYWSARVSTADRIRGEMAMRAKIKEMEESARASAERHKELLESAKKDSTEEFKTLTDENAALKERIEWYQSKYDGADEKERVLVDHCNSLAERLRLTTLNEDHWMAEVARLEALLRDDEKELEQARGITNEERQAFEDSVARVSKAEREAEILAEELARKTQEMNDMKNQYEKQQKILEEQLKRAKDALTELIVSSKEDKRIFDEETKEMRNQLANLHSEMQRASLEEKRMFTAESQELRKQLHAIQCEIKTNAEAAAKKSATSPTEVALPRSLDDRLENLQKQITDHATSFLNRVNALEEKDNEKLKVALDRQSSTAKKIEDRLERLQKEVESAKFLGGIQQRGETVDRGSNHAESTTRERNGAHKNNSLRDGATLVEPKKLIHSRRVDINLAESNRERDSAHKHISPKARSLLEPQEIGVNVSRYQGQKTFADTDGSFETYVSKSTVQSAPSEEYESRDDFEAIDVSYTPLDTALGELTEEQTSVLESLDLSGNRDQIADMLGKVPGLTKNQVNLLVDVALSLAL
ncbi:hypothetical protein ACHAXA_008681 [Cyclostephanos tholiformis]|uniref:Uncharacterized protein n=1 Tax=Cyclostephanos tholiformis TaxID=382380 RepID=A0ABD3RX60_9STRA